MFSSEYWTIHYKLDFKNLDKELDKRCKAKGAPKIPKATMHGWGDVRWLIFKPIRAVSCDIYLEKRYFRWCPSVP